MKKARKWNQIVNEQLRQKKREFIMNDWQTSFKENHYWDINYWKV